MRRQTPDNDPAKLRQKNAKLRKLVHQLGGTCRLCVDDLEDEGDRTYLGSTNHADVLKSAAELYEQFRIDNDDAGADVGLP